MKPDQKEATNKNILIVGFLRPANNFIKLKNNY